MSVINLNCSPRDISPFSGGISDGFSIVTVVNATCSPTSITPFAGGLADGYSTMERLVLNPLDCSILLPVELMFFQAECGSDGVLLEWATASETNTDHFIIERSLDGIDFSEIAQLTAAGTSMGTIDYAFVDQAPPGTLTYYRLKQTDMDGTFEYFHVVPIHCRNGAASELLVYPNPATDLVHIRITDDNEPRQVIILDSHGAVVHQGSMVGSTSFRTEQLAMGMYMVKVEMAGENGPTGELIQRFVKH